MNERTIFWGKLETTIKRSDPPIKFLSCCLCVISSGMLREIEFSISYTQ